MKDFRSDHYLRHNQRRLEHLASLRLNLSGETVLEVGAGIGDHTHFFLDRGCQVVTSDGRPENVRLLRRRYPGLRVMLLDLNSPRVSIGEQFGVVYCYGLLYHLDNPSDAITFMANHCKRLLLLETCVSFGEGSDINICAEDARVPSQSVSGKGCRPTRRWVYEELTKHFDHVYMPITQPAHLEFPIDWTYPPSSGGGLFRSVFVASHSEIRNELLVEGIPPRQSR